MVISIDFHYTIVNIFFCKIHQHFLKLNGKHYKISYAPDLRFERIRLFQQVCCHLQQRAVTAAVIYVDWESRAEPTEMYNLNTKLLNK